MADGCIHLASSLFRPCSLPTRESVIGVTPLTVADWKQQWDLCATDDLSLANAVVTQSRCGVEIVRYVD
jgi:hypothetical protein